MKTKKSESCKVKVDFIAQQCLHASKRSLTTTAQAFSNRSEITVGPTEQRLFAYMSLNHT